MKFNFIFSPQLLSYDKKLNLNYTKLCKVVHINFMSKLFAINKVLEAFYNKSFDFNEPNKIFTNKGLPESDGNYLVIAEFDNDFIIFIIECYSKQCWLYIDYNDEIKFVSYNTYEELKNKLLSIKTPERHNSAIYRDVSYRYCVL